MVFQTFAPDSKYTLTKFMTDPNFNGHASQQPGSLRCWSPGRRWSCCPVLLALAASCAPAVPPAQGTTQSRCCGALGCSILGASTDTELALNQAAPHYRSCPLLESPPSTIVKKGLLEIRSSTANRGYSWMFLLIPAHLQTEVTKINRLMQTSVDGNKSIGRESAVKCRKALPLILAAHLTHCI